MLSIEDVLKFKCLHPKHLASKIKFCFLPTVRESTSFNTLMLIEIEQIFYIH